MRLTSADYADTLAGYDLEIARLEEAYAHLQQAGQISEAATVAYVLARTRHDIELRRPWIAALLAQSLAYEGQNGADHAHERP